MALKIKAAFSNHVIGFNNSSKPLGDRNDLDKLYSLAKAKNNQRVLDMFEEADQKVLDAEKEKVFVEKQETKRTARYERNNLKNQSR